MKYDFLTRQTTVSAAEGGALAYLEAGVGQTHLVWEDRRGNPLAQVAARGNFGGIEL